MSTYRPDPCTSGIAVVCQNRLSVGLHRPTVLTRRRFTTDPGYGEVHVLTYDDGRGAIEGYSRHGYLDYRDLRDADYCDELGELFANRYTELHEEV